MFVVKIVGKAHFPAKPCFSCT